MVRHNLTLFFRNIKKNKSTFFINIVGLSTGFACVLLIALWVMDEINIDKFHVNKSRLYQVVETPEIEGLRVQNPSTAGLMAETMAQEFPEVEYSASVRETNETLLSWEDNQLKANGLFASQGFFDVFSFPLVQGNKSALLLDKNSLILSEGLANRLFSTSENVIGKTVQLYGNTSFTVSGIMEKVPKNSSIQFDFVLPFEYFKEINPKTMDWGYNTTNVYLVLDKGSHIDNFNAKIKNFIGTKIEANGRLLSTRLFSDNYLYDRFRDRVEKSGRITTVRLFSLIAILILLIACVNFMNLSTANASRRLREIGIKKAMGSKRGGGGHPVFDRIPDDDNFGRYIGRFDYPSFAATV